MPRLIPPAAHRRGVTLAELLVAMLLLSIVGTALTRLMVKQQQSYRDLDASLASRRELRLGSSVLPTELRSISTAGGDVLSMSDSDIVVRAALGSGVVCDMNAPRTIWVTPPNLANDKLTYYVALPDVGDTVFVFDEGPLKGAEDDTWDQFAIVDADYNTTRCPGAPYADPTLDAPGSKPRRVYVLDHDMPTTARIGTVVRFTRPVHYRIYQETSGNWYLGMEEFRSGSWQAMTPLAGPFRPYQSGDANPSGLQFRYFDTLGVRVTDYTQTKDVGRIDTYLRTDAGAAAVTERNGAALADSVLMRIAIRNSK